MFVLYLNRGKRKYNCLYKKKSSTCQCRQRHEFTKILRFDLSLREEVRQAVEGRAAMLTEIEVLKVKCAETEDLKYA